MSRKVPEIDPKPAETLTLNGFLFHTGSKRLQSVDGKTVNLRSQSAEVLALLSARPGQIVTRDALMQAVWPDTFVTDDSLTQCIADIRRVLRDAGHLTVETVPKKGYRLNIDAPDTGERARSGAVETARSRPRSLYRTLAALVLITALIGGYVITQVLSPTSVPASVLPRIAILPFDDFSTGEDRGYLSDAVAEGIITELARSKTYAVIARNSSFKYRGNPTDIRQIGKELDVDYLLEGSQQKIGDRLKVTAQLLDARDGSHLWASTYSREIGDLFIVQEEIIRTLADRVGRRIDRQTPKSGAGQVSALRYFLMGVQAIQEDNSVAGNERLHALSLQAIDADPASHFGYLGLAWYHRNDAVFWHVQDHDAALKKAAEYAEKAILLAPDDAKAHEIRAQIHSEAGEVDQALARFDMAIALNPSASDILVNSAGVLLNIGRVDEAIDRIERAKGIDPFHPDWFHWQMGWALWEKDDCAAALAAMQKMSRIPNGAHRMLAGIHACLGNDTEARETLAVFLKDSPGDSISNQRSQWEKNMTPESLDRWLAHMRIAGLPE